MVGVEFFKESDWYFAASPPGKISQWTVWCSSCKLTESSPIFEPSEKQIWFEFGRTKEEAIEKLSKLCGGIIRGKRCVKTEVFNVY